MLCPWTRHFDEHAFFSSARFHHSSFQDFSLLTSLVRSQTQPDINVDSPVIILSQMFPLRIMMYCPMSDAHL